MTTSPSASYDQLLVGFHTRRNPIVRFATHETVVPIRSTLTMISSKQELWYSKREADLMKLEMKSDAIILARTLLATSSAQDLKNDGIHVSQAIGLEKVVNPIEAKRNKETVVRHREAILELQEVTDDEGLCRISQSLSRRS